MENNYWKYAEKLNGRLAMLGLVIGTINYGLFGWIAPVSYTHLRAHET